MLLTVPTQILKDSGLFEDVLKRSATFGSRGVELDLMKLNKKQLKVLRVAAKTEKAQWADTLKFYYTAFTKTEDALVYNLDSLETVGDAEIKRLPNHRLYQRTSDGTLLPFRVITNTCSNTVRSSKAFSVSLAYCSRAEIQEDHLRIDLASLHHAVRVYDLEHELVHIRHPRTRNREAWEELVDVKVKNGISFYQLLALQDLAPESDTLNQVYDKQFDQYIKVVRRYGRQFDSKGTGCTANDSWGRRRSQPMTFEGRYGKVIMNTIPYGLIDTEDKDNREEESYRRRNHSSGDESRLENLLPLDPSKIRELYEEWDPVQSAPQCQSEIANSLVNIPVHPEVRIYHMDLLKDFYVSVRSIRESKFRDNVEEFLVLPDEIKKVTKMLINTSVNVQEDVVEGKSQSTTIISVGDPGLGKTLLAEIMSEQCKKPLYKIQASELGLSAAELETSLKLVLTRAQRWNAILMIDEANAYIHARGKDIKQNAIVGVFLRLIEYYRGILVLTTNMTVDSATGKSFYDIDDAILSRASVVFPFEMPTVKMARKIWALQAKVMQIDLPKALINELADKYVLSGRSIRNLLRQTNNWSKAEGTPICMEHFELCYSMLPRTKKEQLRDDNSNPMFKKDITTEELADVAVDDSEDDEDESYDGADEDEDDDEE